MSHFSRLLLFLRCYLEHSKKLFDVISYAQLHPWEDKDLTDHLLERKRNLLKRGKIDFALRNVKEMWGKLPLPHSSNNAGNQKVGR